MSDKAIKSVIINEELNVLFYSEPHQVLDNRKRTLFATISSLPWFKQVVGLQNKLYILRKSDALDITDSEINAAMYEAVSASMKLEDLRTLLYGNFVKRHRVINMFSSGVDKVHPSLIYFDNNTIYESILKLSDSLSLPDLDRRKIYSEVDYDYAPVWTILLPLVENAIFVSNQSQAEILIESSSSFEDKWNFVTGELYETRIIGKLLMEDWLYWPFRVITRYLLRKHLNYGTKKKAIIIINAFLSPRILKTVLAKFPIYTTYGMQECNHILAINDYSGVDMLEDNCVGKFIKGVSGDIKQLYHTADEGSLVITSKLLSDYLSFERDIWWDTRDHANIKNDLLFIYGKMRYNIDNSSTIGANFENVERIIKSVPYFKEVLIFKDGKDMYHVLVYPNMKSVEAIQRGLLYLSSIIKPFVGMLNENFGIDFFVDIKVMHSPFLKSHTDKIRKGAYIAIIEEEYKQKG
jgi:hypothetical protein